MQAFGLGRFWPFGHRDRDCVQCLLTDVCSDGRLVTSCAVVVGDQMAASDPSCNTDQGLQHACESLGGKPSGTMKVKADVGLLRRESSCGDTSSTDPRSRCGGI